MTGTYAKTTTVPVEKSKAEIERILTRYGADQFMNGWDRERAVLGFIMRGRQVRFVLPLPMRDERQFTHYRHSSGMTKVRTESAATEQWEQACRQRWRALVLIVKAKLEAVEAGITSFEDEFLANIVLPDGGRVGDWLQPQIEQAYLTNQMPKLLGAGS